MGLVGLVIIDEASCISHLAPESLDLYLTIQ